MTNSQMIRLRGLAAGFLVIGSLGWPGSDAFADEFPSKPVRLISPYSAGGLTDVLARLLAKHRQRSGRAGQLIAAETARWRSVVQKAGIVSD